MAWIFSFADVIYLLLPDDNADIRKLSMLINKQSMQLIFLLCYYNFPLRGLRRGEHGEGNMKRGILLCYCQKSFFLARPRPPPQAFYTVVIIRGY